MIILSDGDATACNTQAYTADGGNSGCGNGSQILASIARRLTSGMRLVPPLTPIFP